MGSMPILLYGAEPPPDEPFKNARFVAISKASHTGAIVEAVSRLLSSSVPAGKTGRGVPFWDIAGIRWPPSA
jgi:hypothetical protein